MSPRLSALLVACLLAGCVTITDPVPINKDTYMIALGARGGFSTNAELLAESIKKAGDFCASKGLKVDVQSTKTRGVQMWTPQENQVTFRCLPDDRGLAQ